MIAAIRREAMLISKDFDLITILLVAPIFYALFYTSIYFFKTEHDIPIAVVDADRSELSRTLIRDLDSHQLLRVASVLQDVSKASDLIAEKKCEAFIYIPSGFEAGIRSRRAVDLRAYVNNSRFLVGNDINKAVNEVVFSLGNDIRTQFFESRGYPTREARPSADPLTIDVRSLFNTGESYGDFLIPGILLIILHQTLLIGLCQSIARERERGTLRDLFETSNRSISSMLAGKGALYFALYTCYALFFFTIHCTIFSVPLKGNLLALALFTVLLLVTAIWVGIFIASFFRKKIIALQIIVFTSYPIFLLSGYSWPLEAMPVWMRCFAYCLPTTPYFQAFVRLTQMDAGWSQVLPDFFHLLAVGTVAFVLVRFRLQRVLQKESMTPVPSSALPVV
jgi:ABC-2 type transport system permease protein